MLIDTSFYDHQLSNKMKMSKTYSTDDDEELGLSAVPGLTPEERATQKKLGQGAYHLPGNSAPQDFLQYIRNNHPLFATCCQSPLHPISRSMRAVGLLGIFLKFKFYGSSVNDYFAYN